MQRRCNRGARQPARWRRCTTQRAQNVQLMMCCKCQQPHDSRSSASDRSEAAEYEGVPCAEEMRQGGKAASEVEALREWQRAQSAQLTKLHKRAGNRAQLRERKERLRKLVSLAIWDQSSKPFEVCYFFVRPLHLLEMPDSAFQGAMWRAEIMAAWERSCEAALALAQLGCFLQNCLAFPAGEDV